MLLHTRNKSMPMHVLFSARTLPAGLIALGVMMLIGSYITGCDSFSSLDVMDDGLPSSFARGAETGTVPFWFGYYDEDPEYTPPETAVLFPVKVRIRVSEDSLHVRDAWLAFPDTVVAEAHGRTRLFLLALQGELPKGSRTTGDAPLTHIFSGFIPDLDIVAATLENWLTPTASPREHWSCRTETYYPGSWEYYDMGCYETPHIPCTARVCDRLGEDGPGGGGDDWPPPGDGGGSPGNGDDDDCDPNDLMCDPDPCQGPNQPAHCTNPCETGHNVIDMVQSYFHDLWELSKGDDSNYENRLEFVGILVPSASGNGWVLQMIPQNWYEYQSYDKVLVHIPLDIPEGSYLIHTHPFMPPAGPNEQGERFYDSVDGRLMEYQRGSSRADRARISGHPSLLGGIILDGATVTLHTGTAGEDIHFDRCAF